MNCQKGDLAIIVRSEAGNAGKIVRCLESSLQTFWSIDGSIKTDVAWLVDRDLAGWNGKVDRLIRDSQLRPIRDPGDDAVDETLLRLPSPRQEVTA